MLSQLNKHEDALVNAMNSIILIQDELLRNSLPKRDDRGKEQRMGNEHGGGGEGKKKSTTEERLTILSIAYHNFAVELEHLNKYEQSLRAYQKASEFSEMHLGPENQISQNLKKVYDTAKVTIDGKLAKLKKDADGAQAKGGKNKTTSTNKDAVNAKKDFMIRNSGLADKKASTAESRKRITPSATIQQSKKVVSPNTPLHGTGSGRQDGTTFAGRHQLVTGVEGNNNGIGSSEMDMKRVNQNMGGENKKSDSDIREDHESSSKFGKEKKNQGWSHIANSKGEDAGDEMGEASHDRSK